MLIKRKIWLLALVSAFFLQLEGQNACAATEESEVGVIHKVPSATVGMLIRKPVGEVFEAFVNPEITCNFWFTRGSGRLEPGKEIRWDWDFYGQTMQINVQEIEENKKILLQWGNPKAPRLEWQFTPRIEDTTFVSITNSGFTGNGDEMVEQALNSTGGFTMVLAGAKAYLEHGISLNLIADRYPDKVKK